MSTLQKIRRRCIHVEYPTSPERENVIEVVDGEFALRAFRQSE